MTDRIRIGVVGLGAIAQTAHLPLIRRRWDLFELTAVADVSARRRDDIGELYGVAPEARFANATDLAASGLVDAVVLLTPGNHGPTVLALVEAGIPVLCEKPLAFTRADVERIAAAQGERQLVLVGYMKEYDPASAVALAALQAIPAGDVRSVEVEVLHPADGAQLAFANLLPVPDDVPQADVAQLTSETAAAVDAAIGAEASTTLRTLYTNVVLGSIVHDVSLLRHIAGGIGAVDGALQWPADTFPGSVEVRGWMEGGGRLHIGWHFIPDYPEYRETVEVHHARGTVRITFLVPYRMNSATQVEVVELVDGAVRRASSQSISEAFERELERFAAMVHTGQAPSSGPAEAMADTITGQRIIAALAAARGEHLTGEAADLP